MPPSGRYKHDITWLLHALYGKVTLLVTITIVIMIMKTIKIQRYLSLKLDTMSRLIRFAYSSFFMLWYHVFLPFVWSIVSFLPFSVSILNLPFIDFPNLSNCFVLLIFFPDLLKKIHSGNIASVLCNDIRYLQDSFYIYILP